MSIKIITSVSQFIINQYLNNIQKVLIKIINPKIKNMKKICKSLRLKSKIPLIDGINIFFSISLFLKVKLKIDLVPINNFLI